MTQPLQYTPATSFAQDEAQAVSGRAPLRTANLDAELAAIQLSVNQLIANLGLIQRDDTNLRDGAVKPYTLSSDALALIGSAGFTLPANGSMTWAGGATYIQRNFVMQGGSSYVCLVNHTAGTFASDLAAGKWVIIGGVGSITASGIPFTPTGTIAAANVQAAVAEAANDAVQKSANLADLASAATARANLGAAGLGANTYTGAQTLAGNPAAALEAVPRQYVVGKHTVWVPAGAMKPQSSNGCGTLATSSGGGQVDVSYCTFADGAITYAQFCVAMPKGWDEGAVSAQFVWGDISGAAGSAVWGLAGVALSDGDSWNASMGTAQEIADARLGMGLHQVSAETSAVTIGGSPAQLDTVFFRVYRNGSSGSDTFTGTAALIGVRLYLTTDTPTDA